MSTYTVKCSRTGLEGHGETFQEACEDIARQREIHANRHKTGAVPRVINVDHREWRIESYHY